ncbi:hypothetical protein PSENEW3_00004718 [Picochlorum sp. SENEW3]|nr:hypothetical protein PSENEW3_00004718 [Picochlorum sp. SENEW3]
MYANTLMQSAAIGSCGRRQMTKPGNFLECGGVRRVGRSTRRMESLICHSVRARWCFDCKYGTKNLGAELLVEWVERIGTMAEPGLTSENARISSGSVGSPESRLELEVEFESLEALERFWSSIPVEEHKGWSAKIGEVMIDGSPTWEIYRSIDVFARGGGSEMLEIATDEDIKQYASGGESSGSRRTTGVIGRQRVRHETQSDDTVRISKSSSDEEDNGEEGGGKIVLDWKGDPMTIRPGDKLPFRFE